MSTGWERPWRTLAKDGETEHFATQDEALEAAQRIANETGLWCGVEQRVGNGWWLVDSRVPQEVRA